MTRANGRSGTLPSPTATVCEPLRPAGVNNWKVMAVWVNQSHEYWSANKPSVLGQRLKHFQFSFFCASRFCKHGEQFAKIGRVHDRTGRDGRNATYASQWYLYWPEKIALSMHSLWLANLIIDGAGYWVRASEWRPGGFGRKRPKVSLVHWSLSPGQKGFVNNTEQKSSTHTR